MRVIESSRPGGPEVLREGVRPDPVAGPGEVLIAVKAAGVNRPDLVQREGHYPPPPGVTDIPGLEVSGTIVALGPVDAGGPPRSATGRIWNEGDSVCALVPGGGYASLCVAHGLRGACRSRTASRSRMPRRSPRHSSRCGRTSSSEGGSPVASRCSLTAAPAASAPLRFSCC